MFLRNRWYVAALSSDLDMKPLARTVLGEPVVLYRDREGQAAALEDRCVHRQAPLSLGEVVNGGLQCGYHGLVFNRGGTCIHVPGQSTIPPGASVRSYPVTERFGFVFVWPGAPERAAETDPYDFPWGEKPGWNAIFAKFHAGFDYRLLIDNLMDVTHIAFAHKTTIGSAGVAEQATAKTERDGNKVRVSRWMLNIDPAPTHAAATGYTGKVDRWQIIEYTPPGFVWLQVGSAVAGSGAPEGKMDGVLLDRHSLHALTPETEESALYFWTSAHDTAQVGPEQEKQILEQSMQAFNEDLTIIEGQRARLDPDIPTIEINADAGGIAARRILADLIADEEARMTEGIHVVSGAGE